MDMNRQISHPANRLEDFINMAKQGEKINLTVELRKHPIVSKQSPEPPYNITVDKDMYLLVADFLFTCQSQIVTISKVYALGCADEKMSDGQENRNIANERLKMDYERLSKAEIKTEEKFFQA